MADNAPAKRDWWDKLEAFAKMVAAGGAVTGAVLIPWVISTSTEQSRNAQIYMQIMTEREKSDTDIRAKMFERLLVNYLGEFKSYANRDDEESFRKQIMILDLLSVNFQEFFNSRPLFEEVHRRLVSKRAHVKNPSAWDDLAREIFRVSKNVASRQSLMLNTLGKSVHFSVPVGDVYCVRMYDEGEIARLRPDDARRLFTTDYSGGPCANRGSRVADSQELKPRDARRSIEIYVKRVDRVHASAWVQVKPYDDVFTNGQYAHSIGRTGFEFEVSYFDAPYMDNTKLADGSRLSLLLKDIYAGPDQQDVVEMEAIRFRNDFLSLRDRPAFEEMLRRLGEGARPAR